jgi:CRP/FNR family transcriptional regulator, cyclic AMP receptor protein
MTDSVIVRLEKAAILRVIHQEPAFSEMFIAHLLARAIRTEADLVDQLFNSSEKRLARLLLLLANFGKEEKPEPILAKISQETLADMIGTTRSRVSSFMNKFRKLGFIDYNGGIEVHSSLLNVVLHEEPHINTKSRISTLKWALSSDTPEIAHIARREIGALIDSIQLPPRDAFISMQIRTQ